MMWNNKNILCVTIWEPVVLNSHLRTLGSRKWYTTCVFNTKWDQAVKKTCWMQQLHSDFLYTEGSDASAIW